MEHIQVPNFGEEVTLTLEYATTIDTAYTGREMRASTRYKPRLHLSYTLLTTGKTACLKRRFEAEKELYNDVLVPLAMYPCEVTVESLTQLNILDNPAELFSTHILYAGAFYRIESAYNENTESTYRVGLIDALPADTGNTGNIIIYPAILARKDGNAFMFEDVATWVRKEQVVWVQL